MKFLNDQLKTNVRSIMAVIIILLMLCSTSVFNVQAYLGKTPEAQPPEPLMGGSRANPGYIPFYSDEINDIVTQVSRTDIYNYLLTLQTFGPRVTGNPAFIAAAGYILNEMNQTSPLETNLDYFNIDKMNVIGVLPGLNASNNEILVMGAHFDSVAAGPGADDDASGTAAVMEAAEVLRDHRFERTIVFCAFGGEEQGLHGSKHYAQNANTRGDNIIAMLNYDMIGYTGPDQLPAVDVIGNDPSRWLVDYAYATNVIYQNGLYVDPKINPGMTASDHSSFWNQGYDAFYFGEDWGDPNPHYHKATDTIDKLNMYLIENVTMNAVAMLVQLAGLVDKVVINEVMFNSQTEEDWVELYNTGNSPVNISGWELTDEDGNIYAFPVDTYIPTGKYLTIHWGPGINDSNFGESQPNSKHIYTQTPSIFEDIDQCALYFNNNHSKSTMIDYVAWGGNIAEDLETAYNAGQWGSSVFVDTGNFKIGDTIARDRDSNDADNINDWELTCGIDVDNPTPGAPNLPIKINNEFIGLLDGYGENICFANYTDYTFQVKVNDNNGLNDLDKVILQLDPLGTNLTYFWEGSTDTFIESYDPNNFASINSDPSDSLNDNIDTWTLDFKLNFNWSYPNEDLASCRVHSVSDYGFEIITDHNNIFQIENDLAFAGNLSVHGEYNNELQNGSWARSNESITWSGLKVVYQGTDHIYPKNDDFKVVINNDDGEEWYDTNSSGKSISIRSLTNPSTDIRDLHELKIIGISNNSDMSNISFELKVDGDAITYFDPYPAPGAWLNRTTFECGIKIADINGSGVRADSIDYRIIVEGANEYTGWTELNITEDRPQINCSVFPTFEEGLNNYIQWRAKDLVGNGFEYSEQYQLKLDLIEVEYTDIYPSANVWLQDRNVLFNITVTDMGGSGVDGCSMEYRASTNGKANYGNWLNVGATESSEIVKISIRITFDEGEDNYIQFRTIDIAGNGYTISPDFQIKIKTTDILPNQPPNIIIDYPNSIMSYTTLSEIYFDGFNSTDPDNDVLDFYWSSNISGFLGDTPRFRANLPEGFHQITLTVNDGHGHSVSDSINIELKVLNDEPTDNITDLDGDGMDDSWEVFHGLDPTNPDDANEDMDGDGLTNIQEFLVGSDPTDPSDPQITRQEVKDDTNAGALALLGAFIILLLILIIIFSIFLMRSLRSKRDYVMPPPPQPQVEARAPEVDIMDPLQAPLAKPVMPKPEVLSEDTAGGADEEQTSSTQPLEGTNSTIDPDLNGNEAQKTPELSIEEPASLSDEINVAPSAEPVEGNEE